MKFFRLFALLLVVPMVLSFTSCNKKAEEPKDKPAVDTTAKKEEQKPTVTKEAFMKLVADMSAFYATDDFKNVIRNTVKEAVKDPATFDQKVMEARKNAQEAKTMELIKALGFNTMDEFGAAVQPLIQDQEAMAASQAMEKEVQTVLVGIYEEPEIAKILPKDIKKKVAELKKSLNPPAETAKGEEPKKEEPKKGK